MSDSLPEFDPELAARFRDAHAHIPEDPFVGATLKRAAADSARSVATRRALQVAALVAVIGVSPWLIQGSVLISDLLDQAFVLASAWLAQPVGITILAVAGIALAWKTRLFG